MNIEPIYDVAIIGGGPGGSAAATYLKKLGHSVVLFEMEKFPRHHVGESLIPFCYHKMKEMGVLEEVKKIAAYKPGINFVDANGINQSNWCFKKILPGDSGISFHTLRATFDETLLNNAKKLGADVHEECRVKEADITNENEIILTVSHNGTEFNCKAKFLIDASGQGSFLSKKFNTKKSYQGLDRVAFFTHWKNNNYDAALKDGLIKLIYLEGAKKGWFWVIPIGPDHLSIGISLQNEYVRYRKKQLEEQGSTDWAKDLYLNELSEAKVMNPVLKNSIMQHKVLVLSDYSFYNDVKYGKNWAMVGDAGAFLDPIFSSGIFAAFETASRVSKLVSKQLHSNHEAVKNDFEKEFEVINDGYKLIEKFVRLFYTPEFFNFSHLGTSNESRTYQNWIDTYTIFHFLVSGDFFTDAKKNAAFIDTLVTEKSFNRFKEYFKTRGQKDTSAASCEFEGDAYGHLKIEEQYDWKNAKF